MGEPERREDSSRLDGLNRDLGKVIGRLETFTNELEALFSKFAAQQKECSEVKAAVPDDHLPEHEFLRQLIEREKSRNRIRERVAASLASNTAKGLLVAILILLGLGLTHLITDGGLIHLLDPGHVSPVGE